MRDRENSTETEIREENERLGDRETALRQRERMRDRSETGRQGE